MREGVLRHWRDHPGLEPASEAITRLMREASDHDWHGRADMARALRDEARELAQSGARFLPRF